MLRSLVGSEMCIRDRIQMVRLLEDEPFVSKGDLVKKGQVLCIIEAMKIMNEIESEFDGTIMKVNVNNGDPVEYNQPLFVIKPS